MNKYRVWCKNKKEWEKDFVVLTPDGLLIDVIKGKLRMALNQDNHVIQFSTGKISNNNIEIYQGDIVEFEGQLKDYYYVIEWVLGGFQVVSYKRPDSNVSGIVDGVNTEYVEFGEDYTVVGNIFKGGIDG